LAIYAQGAIWAVTYPLGRIDLNHAYSESCTLDSSAYFIRYFFFAVRHLRHKIIQNKLNVKVFAQKTFDNLE